MERLDSFPPISERETQINLLHALRPGLLLHELVKFISKEDFSNKEAQSVLNHENITQLPLKKQANAIIKVMSNCINAAWHGGDQQVV